MPKRYDVNCDFVMTRGARKGQPCGVGCRSGEGGRCAKHRPSVGVEVETCSICLDEVKFPGGDSMKTDCGHMYHASCLAKVRENKCPMCRASLGRPEAPVIRFEPVSGGVVVGAVFVPLRAMLLEDMRAERLLEGETSWLDSGSMIG